MDEDVLDGMHASHVVRDLYFNGDAVIVLVEILEGVYGSWKESKRRVREGWWSCRRVNESMEFGGRSVGC